MVQQQKLGRFKRLLGQTRKPNTQWKPNYGVLTQPKLQPLIVDGYPQFEKPYDPALRETPPTQRKYRSPLPPNMIQASRLSEDYNEDNFHELQSKFQFEVKGFFPEKAYQAEKEALLPGLQYPAVWLLGVLDCRQMSVDTRRYLQSFATINQPFTLAFDAKVFDTALNLHLVGWLKIRTTFMLGHLQGDTYAMSYFKKYLEEKHLSPEAGTIEWVHVFDYNTGLSTPLHYKHLFCVKDWRKYRTRKAHIMSMFEKWQIRRLQQSSLKRYEEELKVVEEQKVRNF
ncbi:unnamed protein product [Durusdinium trenchii]|uniref:Uncharacterized protein n=1 Tax=Durusdinium trenchii TaxID=1381693 RepID=A0ABP0HBT6_9DINO